MTAMVITGGQCQFVCLCILQVCFQLIDRLLQGAVLGTFSDLTQAADLLLTADNAALQVRHTPHTVCSGKRRRMKKNLIIVIMMVMRVLVVFK